MIYIILMAGANDGFFNESTSPFTTPILHPDGAFFCLLCVFSWVLFLAVWASNHKPPPRERPARGNEKYRRRSREIPWGEHWRN